MIVPFAYDLTVRFRLRSNRAFRIRSDLAFAYDLTVRFAYDLTVCLSYDLTVCVTYDVFRLSVERVNIIHTQHCEYEQSACSFYTVRIISRAGETSELFHVYSIKAN